MFSKNNLVLKIATLVVVAVSCFTHPACFNKPCEFKFPHRGADFDTKMEFLTKFDEMKCDANLNDLKEVAHLSLAKRPSKEDITDIFLKLAIPKMSFHYLDLKDFIKDIEKEFEIP